MTVAAVAAVLGAAHLPLPQIDAYAYRELIAFGYGSLLSPLALGLTPFLFSFVLVEFVAAVVPRWRPLRDGSSADRSSLTTAAWLVALACAAFQAWGMATYLGSVTDLRGDPLIASGWLPALSAASTLVLGTFAAGALAAFVSRRGLGNGFAVIFAAWGVETAAQAGFRTLLGPREGWSDVSLLTFLGVVLIVPLVVARRRRERGGGPPLVPIPTCGVTVLQLPAGILELVFLVAGGLAMEGWELRAPWLRGPWMWLALVVAFAAPLSRLFFTRAAVEATWQRAGVPGVDEGLPGVRRALRSAHARSLALVAGIAALPIVAEELGAGDVPAYDLIVGALVAVAVARDLLGEWQARREGPALVAIRPLQRVYAVEPVLRALAAAGITAHARSRHYRSLFHFFAPYAPIEILVQPERAAEADEICARVVVGAIA